MANYGFIDDETINKYNLIVIGHDEAKNILKNIQLN
jgi:hypothetical protein